MFLDWFIQLRLLNEANAVLSCPDILYIIDESKKSFTRKDWKGASIILAEIIKQGLII